MNLTSILLGLIALLGGGFLLLKNKLNNVKADLMNKDSDIKSAAIDNQVSNDEAKQQDLQKQQQAVANQATTPEEDVDYWKKKLN
jgi:Na+-translocating ferredoxin:NAD+ oxidoreductase RnfG subunit